MFLHYTTKLQILANICHMVDSFRWTLTFGTALRFWFQLLLGTKGVDDDGRFSIDRAFVLTDAATGTLLFFNDGPFLVIAYDGMVGTLFITDKTDLIGIPGNASRLVDMGDAYLNEAFLFNGKRPDRVRRADPSAEIAEFLTVSDPGDKPRGIEASQACF